MSNLIYRELTMIEHSRMRRVKLWACFVGFCLGLLCHASAVTLAWDASPDPDVAGYHLHYGTNGSGSYQVAIDCGNVTTNTVTGLVPGVTYWFVVTAYNTSGLESDPSNEISYTVGETDSRMTVLYVIQPKIPPGLLLLQGTASMIVTQVVARVGTNATVPAAGTTNWSVSLALPVGTNTITVESFGPNGILDYLSVGPIVCKQPIPDLRLTR
jgi:hypothetical protein